MLHSCACCQSRSQMICFQKLTRAGRNEACRFVRCAQMLRAPSAQIALCQCSSELGSQRAECITSSHVPVRPPQYPPAVVHHAHDPQQQQQQQQQPQQQPADSRRVLQIMTATEEAAFDMRAPAVLVSACMRRDVYNAVAAHIGSKPRELLLYDGDQPDHTAAGDDWSGGNTCWANVHPYSGASPPVPPGNRGCVCMPAALAPELGAVLVPALGHPRWPAGLDTFWWFQAGFREYLPLYVSLRANIYPTSGGRPLVTTRSW